MIDPLMGALVLGDLPDEDRKMYYDLLEKELSEEDRSQVAMKGLWNDPNKRCYEARETVFGYIDKENKAIVPASSIAPQEELANQKIDVTLDRFHVQRYPGFFSNKHTIQINFSVEHLINLAKADSQETLTEQSILYGYIIEAMDGQAVSSSGTQIFRGLRIKNELSMKIATIHIKDQIEEQLSGMMKSEAMKKGLKLLSATNPAFSMVTELVSGLTKTFLKRRRNQAIYAMTLGLLINAEIADPKLREGSYVLIQGDSDWFDLKEYCWNQDRFRLEKKQGSRELPFNYMIFSVKRSLEV